MITKTDLPPTIALYAKDENSNVLGTTEELASLLDLPVIDSPNTEYELLLVVTKGRLELHQTNSEVGPVFCDFVSNEFMRRQIVSLRGDLLAKAVGYKGDRIKIVDATAGFGRDAMLLTLLGCEVTAIERDPVVAALLIDGVHRALGHPVLQDAVQLLKLMTGDSCQILSELDIPPDVIYLDPMFSGKNRKARPKKELWALARLVRDDDDGSSLLTHALETGCQRVVVKRPYKGVALPVMDGRLPDIQFRGTTIRFDVYLQPEVVVGSCTKNASLSKNVEGISSKSSY